ncbi:hypothetical protein SNEBB_010238 [Seison nebaliae]|nr:hypothetical protein SNEBB_010238 [Seison nebaliae]
METYGEVKESLASQDDDDDIARKWISEVEVTKTFDVPPSMFTSIDSFVKNELEKISLQWDCEIDGICMAFDIVHIDRQLPIMEDYAFGLVNVIVKMFRFNPVLNTGPVKMTITETDDLCLHGRILNAFDTILYKNSTDTQNFKSYFIDDVIDVKILRFEETNQFITFHVSFSQ